MVEDSGVNLAKSVGVHEALGEDGLGEEGVAQLNPLRLLPAPPSFTLFQTQEKEKGTNKGRAIQRQAWVRRR